MKKFLLSATLLASISAASSSAAHENGEQGPHAMDHAPIGVMADHRHNQGEWMVSLRHMEMNMSGSRDGTNSLSADEIATTSPNLFFGETGQPPTLRVIPTEMPMRMTMAGAMYGLSDKITLMGMTSYVKKDMSHLTYQGGAGTTVLGEFETSAEGFGDSTIGAIIGLDDGQKLGHQLNVGIALTLSTGSNTETDDIQTPMGATPTVRLPYPMQLGTGTFDFKPSLTWFDRSGKIGWGAQASARVPLSKNDEGYRFGNRAEGTAWIAYEPAYWLSLSTRLKAVSQGRIRGIDDTIVAPVQTANPANAGGETIEALFGINLAGQKGALKGHRLALEVGLPLLRDLNGPQLETDSVLTLGWQKAF